MNKRKNNKSFLESGFTTIEIVLTLTVVVLIGAVGWLVYNNSRDDKPKNTVVSKETAKPEKKISNSSTSSSNLAIPEFQVKLVNVPESLKDMSYTIDPVNSNTFTAASFSTKTLSEKCGGVGWIGTVNRYPGTYNKDTADSGPVTLIKQFDGFWLGLLKIGGVPCNENQETVGFQGSQINIFKEYASNPANWTSD